VKLINETIEVYGRSWLVREARSRNDALNAIGMAAATGSVGNKDILDETLCGGGITVLADVVALNADGSERKPS